MLFLPDQSGNSDDVCELIRKGGGGRYKCEPLSQAIPEPRAAKAECPHPIMQIGYRHQPYQPPPPPRGIPLSCRSTCFFAWQLLRALPPEQGCPIGNLIGQHGSLGPGGVPEKSHLDQKVPGSHKPLSVNFICNKY